MKTDNYISSEYSTKPADVSFANRLIPSILFYYGFFGVVLKASKKAKAGVYDDREWCESSLKVMRLLEKTGVRFHVSGIDNLQNHEGPCVIIGNHMSMMETVVLPAIVQPIKRITFIVKESLLTYPVFGPIMRSRDPIAVTRTNPRQDLKTVMDEGLTRLKNGISIIVFPQTTRSMIFDPEQMGTIGEKLAKKADVPIIPLALRTRAWKNGDILKDFGKIDPSVDVQFAFGKPIYVMGKGKEEHHIITEYIGMKLQEWDKEPKGGKFITLGK